MNRNRSRTRSPAWRLGGAVCLALTLALTACDTDTLVDLNDPDLITLDVVIDPENVESVRNGALFEFAQAMAGPAGNNQTPGLVGISGLLADEAWYASTFSTMKEIDRRRIDPANNALLAVYQWLHRARNLTEQAERLLEEARPDSPERSRMLALSGYTQLMFAENWCPNVPFSRAPIGEQIVFRPAIGMEAMLDSAIARFDEAIALGEAAGAGDMVALAKVGKARALQNQGDLAGAATVAGDVPPGFAYAVEYSASSASQNNGVWYNINSEARTSVASGEGVNGIVFFQRGLDSNTIDPRVQVDSLGFGLGAAPPIPHYGQYKYPDRGEDIVLASYTEAQLIMAEADLNGGATAGSTAAGNWLQILNMLRADMGLTALSDPGNAADRVLMLYRERAFWMWLTAHRVGDMRRLLRIAPYSGMFTADGVFPIGATIFNETRGTDVSFPVPVEELNNPEYDAAGCVTNVP